MLINYLMVGLGASFGVLARVMLSNEIKRRWTRVFPLATFIVNLSGAFALGLLNGVGVSPTLSLLLGTGFMGAYTTFSTFNVENVELRRRKHYWSLFCYTGGSYVFGLCAVYAGILIGNVVQRG
ncbi:fluoride efflux transporter FluC [Sporolactobacillus nakayamae]|uniref:Fluoride-specific ion channel FluC n=1 Tax=Sporolactobacillus nakayamae TaxID=269670 RepID=A0A1I2S304_9BACL|nr:CrcB family protein [Sporolactobacillus nakayamae]SFG47315.1 CrcB protein [Sporolactobacillus nakayamae]